MALLAAKTGSPSIHRRSVAFRSSSVACLRPAKQSRKHVHVMAMGAATAEEAEVSEWLDVYCVKKIPAVEKALTPMGVLSGITCKYSFNIITYSCLYYVPRLAYDI